MDTTYYTFQTRKVKVSGGADLLTVVPTAVPAPSSHPAGEVLDFDLCRRKLETRKAWKSLAQAVETAKAPAAQDGSAALDDDALDAHWEAVVPAPEAPAARAIERRLPAHPRTERAGGWLELCASVAVILACVCAGWGFLALA